MNPVVDTSSPPIDTTTDDATNIGNSSVVDIGVVQDTISQTAVATVQDQVASTLAKPVESTGWSPMAVHILPTNAEIKDTFTKAAEFMKTAGE